MTASNLYRENPASRREYRALDVLSRHLTVPESIRKYPSLLPLQVSGTKAAGTFALMTPSMTFPTSARPSPRTNASRRTVSRITRERCCPQRSPIHQSCALVVASIAPLSAWEREVETCAAALGSFTRTRSRVRPRARRATAVNAPSNNFRAPDVSRLSRLAPILPSAASTSSTDTSASGRSASAASDAGS